MIELAGVWLGRRGETMDGGAKIDVLKSPIIEYMYVAYVVML